MAAVHVELRQKWDGYVRRSRIRLMRVYLLVNIFLILKKKSFFLAFCFICRSWREEGEAGEREGGDMQRRTTGRNWTQATAVRLSLDGSYWVGLIDIYNEAPQPVSLVLTTLREKPRTEEGNIAHHLIIPVIISPDLQSANHTLQGHF